MKQGRFRKLLIIYGILIIVAIIYLFPVYWTLVTSLKGLREMMAAKPTFIPSKLIWNNYHDVLFSSKYYIYLRNSLIVGIVSMIITLFLSIGAAYSLSRLHFAGKPYFSLGILAVYLFPGILLVIPLFRIMSSIGLYDNLISVILTHVILALPFGVWTLRAFFDTIPVDLEDAARIDGASRLRTIWSIYLPMVQPGMATVIIYAFVVSWNDFLFPSILLSSPNNQTIPVGIAGWTSSYSINWGQVSAASILTIIPVIILYAFVGRYFVSGLTAGAVKS